MICLVSCLFSFCLPSTIWPSLVKSCYCSHHQPPTQSQRLTAKCQFTLVLEEGKRKCSGLSAELLPGGWEAGSGQAFTRAASKRWAQEFPLSCKREPGRPEGVALPARISSGFLYCLLVQPGKLYLWRDLTWKMAIVIFEIFFSARSPKHPEFIWLKSS